MAEFDLGMLRSGNRRSLAKAITLIESSRPQDRAAAQDILEQCLPHTGNSIRIGITGIPGVGKSTFIEAFGLYLLSHGKRVAVLAVDPSSSTSGGTLCRYMGFNSLLGVRLAPQGGSAGRGPLVFYFWWYVM